MIEDSLTAEQHNDLGYVYEQKKAYELAEKEYLLAVKKREDWPIPYFNLGNLACKTGNYKKSEDFFRKVLTLDPNNTDAMNNLAVALLMQDRLQEAKLLVEKALKTRHKDEYEDTLKEIQKKEVLSHRR
ncbi:MAG TPA: tetratricopeptide repeat protein [Syntrophales bacterium]|nr:tetratricopeptide repeat protein [Syntrophales bacterium]HRT26909.1 tetratricopeptide repeat protein [Syntrophales bacterium]